MEAENKNNKMETATEKLARMKKEMADLEKAVAKEEKEKSEKERQEKAIAFSKEKRTTAETKALLVKLYLLENPAPAEKKPRGEKKPAKIKYGRCIGRAWGEGYGCRCGKNAVGENGFCTKHNKELELPGNCIALGLWEEQRPTHFKGGKMNVGKGEKIGSEIKWKNREKAETEEKSEEEEVVVEELGAEA